ARRAELAGDALGGRALADRKRQGPARLGRAPRAEDGGTPRDHVDDLVDRPGRPHRLYRRAQRADSRSARRRFPLRHLGPRELERRRVERADRRRRFQTGAGLTWPTARSSATRRSTRTPTISCTAWGGPSTTRARPGACSVSTTTSPPTRATGWKR